MELRSASVPHYSAPLLVLYQMKRQRIEPLCCAIGAGTSAWSLESGRNIEFFVILALLNNDNPHRGACKPSFVALNGCKSAYFSGRCFFIESDVAAFNAKLDISARLRRPCSGNGDRKLHQKDLKETCFDCVFASEPFEPVGGDSFHAVNDSSQCSRNGAGCVGIVSKIHGIKHALLVVVGVG